MTGTVLVVEDDPRVRQALGLALADEGYRVIDAATGAQALRRLADEQQQPDLVLLDLMLPDIDGMEVCSAIRTKGDLPIIMVTARSDAADVIAGLEAGADDYVTKPLDAGVLSARIKALLRRARPAETGTPAVLDVGGLQIYPDQGRVVRDGVELALTRTEFRLLCELAVARGAVVTREQLLERVWNYDYFGDTRLLDVHVRRLRRKIEPDPGRPTHIVTVRGVGYRVSMPTDVPTDDRADGQPG